MGIFSLVDCEEVHGTYQENASFSDYSLSVDLRVAWDKRYDLVNDILLNARTHPYSPLLVARSAGIRALPADGQVQPGQQTLDYFDFAIVSMEYSIGNGGGSPQDPVDLVSEELRANAEFITEDYKGVAWTDETWTPGQPPERQLREAEAPGHLRQTLSLVRTIYNQPSIPNSYLTLPGSCNDNAYTSKLLGLTFPEETLLFVPQPNRRMITTAGSVGWTMQIEFSFKPWGWNKFWFPDQSKYLELRRIDPATGDLETSPYKNHPPADFSDWLF